MFCGPPLVLPEPEPLCCPGVPVGRADRIAFCSALVDTPSFDASVASVVLENPPGPPPPWRFPPVPLLFGGAAVVEPLEPLCCVGAAACAAELLVLLLLDEPHPATAPPKRAVVPTSTAILRMRLFFMSITIGTPPERELGPR
jgi:hypothetical protein